MSSFAEQLKAEVARIARKQVKAETQALKKAASQQRADMAALRRRVSELEGQLRRLSRKAGRAEGQIAQPTADEDGATALRFRVAGFANLRKKLGLSAADMGRLLGVSAQSVYHWETGKSRPRAAQLQAIAGVRKLGKREVAARLAAIQ